MRWMIFLLPMLAWAQAPAVVHGSIADPTNLASQTNLRLIPVDRPEDAVQARIEAKGYFQLANVVPGWYLLAAGVNYPEKVKALHIEAGQDVDTGEILPGLDFVSAYGVCTHCIPNQWYKPPPVQILSVCEALATPESFRSPVIIVGIFKSGMDQTLRQDCPNELRSGDVGWLSAIALSGSTEPPDQYRDQIEKKKAEIYASYPAAAKPRPERLVGLYGILIMPDGLTSAPCCHAAAETTFAPARLIGINEKDFRVIR